MCQRNPTLMENIESLIIDPGHKLTRLRPFRLLIEKASHIQSLSVYAPSNTPRSILSTSVSFSYLAHFHTNLSHSSVVLFLSLQPQLETLTLGSCGTSSSPCPLALAPLGQLLTLTIPSTCVHEVEASGHVQKMTLVSAPAEHRQSDILFNPRPLVMSASIMILDIPFWSGDQFILQHISVIAPNVVELKLEEPSNARVSSRSWLYAN